MCDNDCYHIGREEKFWPLAESIARVHLALYSKSGLPPAHIASKMDEMLAEMKTRRDLPGLLATAESSTLGGPPDESSLPPFEYSPLEEAESIRVLILHPGKPSDPLRGTIRHQLYSRVSYEAMSYCWGDDSTPRAIILDGKQKPLTQSLYEALVRLRKREHSRIVWADGVSINQADNREKSVQVGLMPEIFKQAKVFVYLGGEEYGSQTLPSLMEALRKFDHRAETNSLLPDQLPDGFLKSRGLPPQNDISWFALVAFLCRPWFLRMWVIQEIVLARSVSFICGDWELSWRDLSGMANRVAKVLRIALRAIPAETFMACDRAAASLALMLGFRETRSLVEKRLQEIQKGIEQDDRSLSPIDTALDEEVETSIEKRREYVVWACRQHPEIYHQIESVALELPDEVLPSKSSMLYLLGLFWQNRVTRPQDRLFALAGLSYDMADFPPDYGETLDQTNLRFSRFIVSRGQGMDLLYHATKRTWELDNPNLPSWAAEWTAALRSRGRQDHWIRLGWEYHGGWQQIFGAPSVRLDEDSTTGLKVTSFRVARISSAINFWPMNDHVLEEIARFFTDITKIFSGEPYLTGESWEEVSCRTLIANHIPGMREPEPITRTLSSYRAFLERLPDIGKRKPKGDNRWAGQMIRWLPGKAVFETENGYVGIAPDTIAPSDEIHMFERSNLPFALRPSKARPGYYLFLGGCYIHGLMAGKAWEIEHVLQDLSLI